MDKEYQSIFKKMEELLVKASEQQKNIKNRFDSFSLTQNEIELKLNEINIEFRNIVSAFKNDSYLVLSEFKQDSDILLQNTIDDQKDLSGKLENKVSSFINNLELKFLRVQEKSDELIKDIYDKSNEILNFHTEIVNIQESNNNLIKLVKQVSLKSDQNKKETENINKIFESSINLKASKADIKNLEHQIKDNYNSIGSVKIDLSTMTKETQAILHLKAEKSEIENLTQQLSNLNDKILKLEKFAHKHKILGGKI